MRHGRRSRKPLTLHGWTGSRGLRRIVGWKSKSRLTMVPSSHTHTTPARRQEQIPDPRASAKKEQRTIRASCRFHQRSERPQEAAIALTRGREMPGLCFLSETTMLRAARASIRMLTFSSRGCTFESDRRRLMARLAESTLVLALGACEDTEERKAKATLSEAAEVWRPFRRVFHPQLAAT